MDDDTVRRGAVERAKDASLLGLTRKVLGSHALGPSNKKKSRLQMVFKTLFFFFPNNKLWNLHVVSLSFLCIFFFCKTSFPKEVKVK